MGNQAQKHIPIALLLDAGCCGGGGGGGELRSFVTVVSVPYTAKVMVVYHPFKIRPSVGSCNKKDVQKTHYMTLCRLQIFSCTARKEASMTLTHSNHPGDMSS